MFVVLINYNDLYKATKIVSISIMLNSDSQIRDKMYPVTNAIIEMKNIIGCKEKYSKSI